MVNLLAVQKWDGNLYRNETAQRLACTETEQQNKG